MQNRKALWKLVRKENPCRFCGREHQTGNCPQYTKTGKNKQSLMAQQNQDRTNK